MDRASQYLLSSAQDCLWKTKGCSEVLGQSEISCDYEAAEGLKLKKNKTVVNMIKKRLSKFNVKSIKSSLYSRYHAKA